MPRKPRVQFPGAIYHIVTRGDGRRGLFHDEDHYDRLTKGLADEVNRSRWEVLAFCWMPNHIHLLLTTPEPNLSAGMQHWLSGYANWYAKRNRRTGHLFQGRYKSFLVEDETYYWTLSRYIHLKWTSLPRSTMLIALSMLVFAVRLPAAKWRPLFAAGLLRAPSRNYRSHLAYVIRTAPQT